MIHDCKSAFSITKADKKTALLDLLHEINVLMVGFQAAWLERNRIGRMIDNLSRFNILLDE